MSCPSKQPEELPGALKDRCENNLNRHKGLDSGKVQLRLTKPFKPNPQWARAKKVCRLNMEDIQMAKELGLSPKSLIKNQPNPSQQWKLPVKQWIRELHAKRFGSRAKTANHPAPPRCPPHPDGHTGVETAIPDEDIPF